MKSRNQTILDHLLKGYSITPAEAASQYQIYSLAEAIRDLRNVGNEIHTEMNYPSGRPKFGRYTLVAAAKKAA